MNAHHHQNSLFTSLLRWSLVFLCVLASRADAQTLRWDAMPSIPDIVVLNQNGEHVRFYSDLVKGKTVVINFIFTNCTTVCPILTAVFRKTQQMLSEDIGRGTQFISISVDPVNDRPEVLRQYAAKFEAGPNWAFVTGAKPDIDKLLKSLGGFSLNKIDHQSLILVGNEKAGIWTRSFGITSPAAIVSIINSAASKSSSDTRQLPAAEVSQTDHADHIPALDAPSSSALKSEQSVMKVTDVAKYFTNLPLLTHEGKSVRFYDDLIQGKIVLINTLFTQCTMICSPMTRNLAKVQDYLGADWARNVHMISITADPEHDTPQVLKEFANKYHANSRWTFVTGKKENVDWVLYKLGAYTESKDDHYSLLIIGNEATGAWMKLLPLAKPEEIASAIKSIATSSKN